jgi:Sec-independent protein translocase protein TatA
MALEDYLEPEVAVTAVVTAAVFSPKVRGWIRRGLVYGTAGVLIAGDALTSFARSVGQGVQQAGAAAANATQNVADQAKETVTSATEAATGNTTQKKSTPKTMTDSTKSPTEGTGGQV